MTIVDHFETFHGLPVFTLPEPGDKALPAAGDVAWRLDCYAGGDIPFAELWRSFTDRVPSAIRTAFDSTGTEVDLSDHRTPDSWGDQEWRYVAVSE
ncbi:hypothetical protein ACWEP4_00130 [Streptomyces sp. NPDC004227]